MIPQVSQRKWEPWSWGVQWLAIRSWQWPTESSPRSRSSYNCARSCRRTQHSMVVQPLKQTGKVKKLIKWVPRGLTRNQKKSSFWSVIFSYSTQQQWAISQLDCDVQWKVDFVRQLVMSSSVVGPRRNSQSTPWSQTCTKKRSWSLSGGLLPVWSSTAFWIPVKPYHLRSVLSRLLRCAENCSSCSRHWSTDWAQFFSMAVHNPRFRSWMNWGPSFASFTVFTWPLANRLSLLQASRPLFAGKMFPQPAGGRKCFPRDGPILKQGFFCYKNKQTFLVDKMCWL